MRAARSLPGTHLNSDGRDVIKLAIALIATLVALVLGLMIATAKGAYDSQAASVRQMAANLLLLDRILAEYGPDAAPPRGLLREAGERLRTHLWPDDGASPRSLAPDEARAEMRALVADLIALAPANDGQHFLKARALQVTSDLGAARFQLYVQSGGGPSPTFVLVLAFWLIILFGGYGLIAPRNATIITFLVACSVSVAAALFLILELADPFGGVIRLPDEPLRQAISQMGQ